MQAPEEGAAREAAPVPNCCYTLSVKAVLQQKAAMPAFSSIGEAELKEKHNADGRNQSSSPLLTSQSHQNQQFRELGAEGVGVCRWDPLCRFPLEEMMQHKVQGRKSQDLNASPIHRMPCYPLTVEKLNCFFFPHTIPPLGDGKNVIMKQPKCPHYKTRKTVLKDSYLAELS